MPHYLTLDKKNATSEILEIQNSVLFTRSSDSRLKNHGASLFDIDMFTAHFKDEEELIVYLISEGIIDPEKHAGRTLSIRYIDRKTLKKETYGLFFQSDLELMISPQKLKAIINQKLMNQEFGFIEQFLNHFKEYRECYATAADVRMANNESQAIGAISHRFFEHANNSDEYGNILIRMVNLLIYKYKQDKAGNIVFETDSDGNRLIKYTNYHRVLAFVKDKSMELDIPRFKVPNQAITITIQGSPDTFKKPMAIQKKTTVMDKKSSETISPKKVDPVVTSGKRRLTKRERARLPIPGQFSMLDDEK